MALKIALALACLVTVFAADPYSYGGGYKETYPDAKPYYNFAYTVKDDYSGNYYGHEEKRDGYETQGAYRVLLPDGRTQTVSYTANEYGYNADVQYDGYPKYDNYKPTYKAAPSYHEPKYSSYEPSYKPSYKPQAVYHPAPSYHTPKYAPAPSYGYKPSYKPTYGYSKY